MRFIPHAWDMVDTHAWGMMNTHEWGIGGPHAWGINKGHYDCWQGVIMTVDEGSL